MGLRDKLYKVFIYKKITGLKKRRFSFFGKNSVIEKPYLQLSGTKNISIGRNVTILKNSRLSVYGESVINNITIGDNSYIGFGFTALSDKKSKISIGKDVLIASNVLITNEDHGINPASDVPYMNQDLMSKDVSIGDGTWLGQNVCVLPGVSIGKKCIVGAGAIVTKSIPDYSIAVGNPAKVIKQFNFKSGQWEAINSNEKK